MERTQTFETAIIERYRRRELGRGSLDRDVSGRSLGAPRGRYYRGFVGSPSTVSDLNKKIYGTIEVWRNRPIESEHPYVYLTAWRSSAATTPFRRSIGVAIRSSAFCARSAHIEPNSIRWRNANISAM
jgi:hypothetical protein